MIDFVSIYMPSIPQLQTDAVADVRTRLVNYTSLIWPDLDPAPNTVIGDLLVTPQANLLAALEQGMDNFMSDLDLANVSKNIIYNCDFVSRYLQNFATDTSLSLQSSGVARLVFTSNKQYNLDRGTQFEFDGSRFSIYLPFMGEFIIYPVGANVPSGINGVALRDSGSSMYFADIPLMGTGSIGGIAAGTNGVSSLSPTNYPELQAIVALVDFNTGSDTSTLAELAKKTTETIYSASLSSRNGAIRFVKDMCPFVEGIYAINNSDAEMVRAFYNGTGMKSGCLDIYARSQSFRFTETQQIRLNLDLSTQKFYGDFPYTGQPYFIESVTHTGVDRVLPYTIYTQSNNTEIAPAPLHAYSSYERLTLEVPNILDPQGDSIFNPTIDSDGTNYTYFTVAYKTDPLLPAISDCTQNPDNIPVNTSLLTRGFIPIIISKFEVCYVVQPGVVPLLSQALTDIQTYLTLVGAPDVYSDAPIIEIMKTAGVRYVDTINVAAKVQWSVGTKIGTPSDSTPVLDGPYINSTSDLRIKYPVTPTPDNLYAVGIKNIRYYLLDGAVTFKEVREI